MKKLLAFALTCMLCTSTFYAQNDWKPGFIIKNSGDTVYGLIDNRDSKSFSKQCVFRKQESAEMEKFGPDEILGYRFTDDRLFVSRSLPEKDSTQKVFLEFIINGTVDIFHYKDVEDHFFIEKDGKLYELKNTTAYIRTEKENYLDRDGGKLIGQPKKEYVGILNSLMADANMQAKINASVLGRDPLIRIAKEYHERTCPDEACMIYEKKNKIHVKYGLHVGASMNSFNIAGRTITDYRNSAFIGLRFKYENIFAWAEKISLSTDVSIHNFSKYELYQKTGNTVIDYNGVTQILYEHNKKVFDLKMTVLKVPITVNYTFSRGFIRPYVSLGISNSFVLSQNKRFTDKNMEVFHGKSSIPNYLVVGGIARAGTEFVFKNGHSIYTDVNWDYSQNIGGGASIFSNMMYSFTIGYSL